MGQAERPKGAGANKSIRRGGRFNDSTIHAAIARHMSERVFYPDTGDVSNTSKVVALSIAVFRFNALTIQRFNEALAAKALATAARGKSHSMIVVC